VSEVTRAYFGGQAKLDRTSEKDTLAAAAKGDPAAIERVAESSPVWNSMLRTTCVATMLEGGHARNALPQLAAANVNCRVLSGRVVGGSAGEGEGGPWGTPK